MLDAKWLWTIICAIATLVTIFEGLRGNNSKLRKAWHYMRPFLIPFPADALQAWIASSLDKGDSVVLMSNTSTRKLCVNTYVFNPSGEMIACGQSLVHPNTTASYSCLRQLINNRLLATDSQPYAITIKLLASIPIAGVPNHSACNAGLGSLAPASGIRVWGKSYAGAETPFAWAKLTRGELKKLTTTCAFIQIHGAGAGICNSCIIGAIQPEINK